MRIKTEECKTSDYSDSELDEEEANFVRKLKRRYKGKLPFKWFRCEKIGHFSHKFPYEKNGNNNVNEDSSFMKYNEGKTEKKKKFYRIIKKGIYIPIKTTTIQMIMTMKQIKFSL